MRATVSCRSPMWCSPKDELSRLRRVGRLLRAPSVEPRRLNSDCQPGCVDSGGMDPTPAAQSTAFQYGVLGVVALIFAYAIVHLFRTMRADLKAMEEERGKWRTEREALRTEYERKHRELVESFAQAVREERDTNRAHEDQVRKEFAELMERIATESGRASQALVAAMEKFYDRLVGPTARGR